MVPGSAQRWRAAVTQDLPGVENRALSGQDAPSALATLDRSCSLARAGGQDPGTKGVNVPVMTFYPPWAVVVVTFGSGPHIHTYTRVRSHVACYARGVAAGRHSVARSGLLRPDESDREC